MMWGNNHKKSTLSARSLEIGVCVNPFKMRARAHASIISVGANASERDVRANDSETGLRATAYTIGNHANTSKWRRAQTFENRGARNAGKRRVHAKSVKTGVFANAGAIKRFGIGGARKRLKTGMRTKRYCSRCDNDMPILGFCQCWELQGYPEQNSILGKILPESRSKMYKSWDFANPGNRKSTPSKTGLRANPFLRAEVKCRNPGILLILWIARVPPAKQDPGQMPS